MVSWLGGNAARLRDLLLPQLDRVWPRRPWAAPRPPVPVPAAERRVPPACTVRAGPGTSAAQSSCPGVFRVAGDGEMGASPGLGSAGHLVHSRGGGLSLRPCAPLARWLPAEPGAAGLRLGSACLCTFKSPKRCDFSGKQQSFKAVNSCFPSFYIRAILKNTKNFNNLLFFSDF